MPTNKPMAPADTTQEGAFAPVERAARRHWLLVVACVLLAAGAAYGFATYRAPVYEATSQILVTPVNTDNSYAGLPVLTNSVDPTRTLQTAASVLESTAVAQSVANKLSRDGGFPPITFEQVGEDVKVDSLGDSDIVSIVAQRDTAADAVTLTATYAREALALRSDALKTAVQGTVNGLRRRLATLDSNSPAAVEVARELSDLQAVRDGQDPNFSLLTVPAGAIRTGVSSRILLALGIIGGLLLGVLGAVVLDRVSRRVRDEEELLDLYPLAVLARIPPMSAAALKARGPDLVPVGVREAMRTLQVQLEDDETTSAPQAEGTPAGRAVMFTSPSAGDGKTTVAMHFAFTVAASGARVIVLDFDLRKSEVGNRLGLQVDMMDLLQRDVRMEDMLIEVPTVPGLSVLSARADRVLAPLFEAVMRRIPDLVAEARQLADYVVIDTAPVAVVSDALRVISVVDDVVLVVRPGHTERDHITMTQEILERLGHSPSGMVVVGRGRSTSGADYGYGVEVAPATATPGRTAAPTTAGELATENP